MGRLPARLAAGARQLLAAFRVLCDWRSRLRFVRLRLGWPGQPEGETVPLRLRALEGRALHVRPGTSDAVVVVEDFVLGFADPPAEVAAGQLARIVELGTNIGAGLAALAQRYPHASVLGVEADPANAALARRNLEPWADRCQVLETAVWEGPGDPVIDRAGGRETGFTVRARGAHEDPSDSAVPAATVDDILEGFHPGEPIDYLYLDIEGTHERLLSGEPRWLGRVRAIKVSRHAETAYSEADCARDLERLGFRARVEPLEPTGWTVGVRP
jgi:FkbM family methyltransferase